MPMFILSRHHSRTFSWRSQPMRTRVAGRKWRGHMFSIFRGLNAILFKEFITVLRDPMTLFFMLFPPLIEMIAFGYALDNDVRHMAMAILNEDRTVESRQLLDRFVNTETFRIVGEVQNVEQLASEIRK